MRAANLTLDKRHGKTVLVSDEATVQRSIVQYLAALENQKRLAFFAVPNQVGTRTRTDAAILQGLGVRPGVADLVVFWPEGRVGFLEVKNATGRTSKAQETFYWTCRRMGARHAVVRGIRETEDVLKSWGVI